ncbi:MAG TPA: hypothetical protein ACHBX0_09185 [Arsenophonus sp.]
MTRGGAGVSVGHSTSFSWCIAEPFQVTSLCVAAYCSGTKGQDFLFLSCLTWVEVKGAAGSILTAQKRKFCFEESLPHDSNLLLEVRSVLSGNLSLTSCA